MKKFFLAILFLLISARGVWADDALVRLSRVKTGESPLPILVTWTSDNTVAAGNLLVTVGSGWTVNQNTASITVGTTGLPDGVIALPNLTINSVSGNTVTFGRGGATVGVTYGFWIYSGIGTNPAVGDGGVYKWSVGGKEVKVAVIADDNIVVTGRVGALASDFQLVVNRVGTTDLTQNIQVDYEIKYGSYLQNSTKPLKIVAEWGLGTINGSGAATLEMVDYVSGSGSTAWAGVVPVIDLINRKIEWTISSFPANTQDGRVTFSLKTTDNYKGGLVVTFPVKAWLYGANVVSMSESIVENYHYLSTITPTPTPNPTSELSEATVTAVPTSVVTPIVTPISRVELTEITDTSVLIKVVNNFEPTKIKINYGEFAHSLAKSIVSLGKEKTQEIKIDNLKPNKRYYFSVQVLNTEGEVAGKEVYTFVTANGSEVSEVLANTLLVLSDNNVVWDSRDGAVSSVQMTPNNDYSFKFKVDKPELIKSIKLMVRNKQVLGLSSWVFGAESGQESADLVDIGGGVFVGHVISPLVEGRYDIVVRIVGVNGSVSEKNIGELRVVRPMRAVTDSKKPIEGVMVKLSRFNWQKKLFEEVNRENFGYANPLYTDVNGEVKISLPSGKYQAELTAPGYAAKIVEFVIGDADNEKPPIIVLEQKRTDLASYFGFYSRSIEDVKNVFVGGVSEIIKSQRFFKLYSMVVLVVGFGLWIRLLIVVVVKSDFLGGLISKNTNFVVGEVSDFVSSLPITGAKVYLINEKNKSIVGRSKTNYLGLFRIKLGKYDLYKIMVQKIGYHPSAMLDYTREGLTVSSVRIWLKKNDNLWVKIVGRLEYILGEVLVLPMCGLLVIAGGLFCLNFGLTKVILIWLVSIVNLYLFFEINKK